MMLFFPPGTEVWCFYGMYMNLSWIYDGFMGCPQLQTFTDAFLLAKHVCHARNMSHFPIEGEGHLPINVSRHSPMIFIQWWRWGDHIGTTLMLMYAHVCESHLWTQFRILGGEVPFFKWMYNQQVMGVASVVAFFIALKPRSKGSSDLQILDVHSLE